MNYFIKFIFTILGAGLIGFGLGIIIYRNAVLSPSHFEVIMVFSFVAGGFFMAMGIPGRKIRQEDEPIDHNNSQLPQN